MDKKIDDLKKSLEANRPTLTDGFTCDMAFNKINAWAQANSLWVLAYGTGCGAIELAPTMTSRYDWSRHGIGGAATPRQADLLLISGYLSTKTLKRVIRSYEQMQDPKYVIGFGSCTINGGMYYDSYNTIKRLELYLPVDVYINGCMPRPEAVISALTFLKKKIKDKKADGWIKYKQNYEWYKENQKKIIKSWRNMPDIYNW